MVQQMCLAYMLQVTVQIQLINKLLFQWVLLQQRKHMYTLAKDSKVLDVNSPYSYVMWSTYFQQTSMIATYKDERIGFISGYILPEQPDTLFIWQVAVSEKFRGFGLATRMINALYDSLKSKG